MAESVREAINLKEVLLSLEENNEEFRRLQKHIEIASAFYGGELKERSEAGLRKINSALESGKEMYDRLGESSRMSRAAFMQKVNSARSRKEYGRMNSLLKRNRARCRGCTRKHFQDLWNLRRKTRINR